MKKFLYVSATVITFSLMVIAWIVSFHLLIELENMNLICFTLFFLPASVILSILLFYLFYQVYMLFSKNDASPPKSVIKVCLSFLLISALLFLYPFLPVSDRVIADNRQILDTLSIENALKSDLVSSESQFENSYYKKKKIGNIEYISSDYSVNFEQLRRTSEDKITACSFSLEYIKNVPDLFYHAEKNNFLHTKDWLEDLTDQYNEIISKEEIKGANYQTRYAVYLYENDIQKERESELSATTNTIIILAENGRDILLYNIEWRDDSGNSIIDKDYILNLVKNIME